MKNIDVAVDDEDQVVLSYLLRVYKNFVDTIIFGRNSLSMEEVKTTLQSWELKRRITDSYGGISSSDQRFNGKRKNEGKEEEMKREKHVFYSSHDSCKSLNEELSDYYRGCHNSHTKHHYQIREKDIRPQEVNISLPYFH